MTEERSDGELRGAELSGLDADDFLSTMKDYREPGDMGDLSRLAGVLGLTEREKMVVAGAYAFGRGGAEELRRAWERDEQEAGDV